MILLSKMFCSVFVLFFFVATLLMDSLGPYHIFFTETNEFIVWAYLFWHCLNKWALPVFLFLLAIFSWTYSNR